MADWRALEARVDRKMAATFGESVRLSFLKNGDTDPDRPMIEITAILHTGGDDSFAAGTGYRTRLSAGQAELIIDRSSYAGSMPRPQDKVRANDRAGMPWFEVSAVSDRYSNLLVLSLGQA
jgi:hypothetical protein